MASLTDRGIYRFCNPRRPHATDVPLVYVRLAAGNGGLLKAAADPDGRALYLVLDGHITNGPGYSVGGAEDLVPAD